MVQHWIEKKKAFDEVHKQIGEKQSKEQKICESVSSLFRALKDVSCYLYLFYFIFFDFESAGQEMLLWHLSFSLLETQAGHMVTVTKNEFTWLFLCQQHTCSSSSVIPLHEWVDPSYPQKCFYNS